jgi:hypothetical protein
MRHRGKGGQRGGSEPTLDPDRVQARPRGHYVRDVRESRDERSRSSRAR